MLRKLRLKFVVINMAIVTAMLCVIFALVYHFTQADLEAESVGMMQRIAAAPFHVGAPGDDPGQLRLPYFVLEVNGLGDLAAAGGYYDLSDKEFLQQLVDQALSTGQRTGVLPQYSLRFCSVATPAFQRIVFADMSSELSTLDSLLRTCMAIGSVSFAAFLIISLLLARWAVGPVDQAWQQQRQFVADASHELKTPLAVITTNAELLQSPDFDQQAKRQFSQSILAMSRQMRGLVERLLELARVDNGSPNTAFTRCDFSALVSQAALPFEAVFFERGLTLTCQLEPGIVVHGSPAHLSEVVEILLDNAQKYTQGDGQVRVALERRHRGHCLLTVSNPGPPLSSQQLQDIFKRFYRADQARSRDGSFGLGRSIAQASVSEHKGRIWAQSAGGVNTFLVQLPALSGPVCPGTAGR